MKNLLLMSLLLSACGDKEEDSAVDETVEEVEETEATEETGSPEEGEESEESEEGESE